MRFGRLRVCLGKDGRGLKTKFFTVAKTTEIDPGRARVVYVQGIEIALFNIGGEFYAVDNLCPHEGGPLVAGTLQGMVLTCPWHRWKFHLKTGCSPINPAVQVQTYPVQIEGEEIRIGMATD